MKESEKKNPWNENWMYIIKTSEKINIIWVDTWCNHLRDVRIRNWNENMLMKGMENGIFVQKSIFFVKFYVCINDIPT